MEDQNPSKEQFHVWLIDDDENYRRCVREAFQQTKQGMLLHEFVSCEAALEWLQRSPAPAVILLDISLPEGMSGLKGLTIFRQEIPETRILMVTISDDDEDIYQAFCHGAIGYLVKTSIPEKTIEAVKDAIEGRSFIDSHIASKILKMQDISIDLRNKYQLTQQELKILGLIKAGYGRKTVVNELCIAESTLKYHLKNIYSKLQVHTLTEAVTKTFPKK